MDLHEWFRVNAKLLQLGQDALSLDMAAGVLQLSIDMANKHERYELLVEAILMLVFMSDKRTHALNSALKDLISYILEQCPPARALFISEMNETSPSLLKVLL